MIRRGFWLTVGAAGGIMGYRRAAALGRRVSGSLGAQRATGAGRRPASRSLVRDAIRATRGARSFSRDVREGMELYMARRPRPIPPTLPASTRGPGDQRSVISQPNEATSQPNDVTAKDDR